MPPTDRFVIRFAAEPPREPTPYGRWADALTTHFLGACHSLETDGEDLGEAGAIAWFPDRSYSGRTYVPAVALTLVWGVPMVGGGSIVTAELADLAVDQCALVEERFTLLSADNYRGDYLEIKLWDGNGAELASEPLWVDDDEQDESDDAAQAADGESDGESDTDGPA